MKAEREKREGPDLIDRSQFAVYSGTAPEGMDAGSYIAGASTLKKWPACRMEDIAMRTISLSRQMGFAAEA